jgi:uroporphyrinogen-III synthase
LKIKKVLVSQPKPTSDKSPYYDIAEKYGVEIDFRPFIKVESLSAKEFRQQKVSILDHTAIVFTSRHAIDHFFTLCAELRVTIPETMKYFCTSEQIALYIQKYVQYRKRKVFFGATGKFNDLIPSIVKHNTEKYFVPMSDVHTDEIKNALDAKKIQHTEAVMYRTVSNDFTPEEKFDYDMLLFFSPAGIQSLLKNFPEFDQKDIAIGCFGPATAKAVKDAGLRLDLEAPTVEAPSMTAALEMYLKNEMADVGASLVHSRKSDLASVNCVIPRAGVGVHHLAVGVYLYLVGIGVA